MSILNSNNSSTLSSKAALTFVSGLLQQGARFLVGFVVSPIVIRGLGPELYGAFQMIQQTVGYLSLSDMRPMGTLKFTLAVRQHIDDIEEKRRQIGSALLLWTLSFPIFLLLGTVTIWFAPSFIRTVPAHFGAVRLALAIVFFSVAVDRLLSLPGNVLRGMNLDYKAMGLNAVTVLLGGLLSAAAIWSDLGLPGVAAASVLGALITGGARFWVAKRALSWFGAAMPRREEFIEFAQLSGWLFLYGLSSVLLAASDLVLVGYLLGPSAAAVYATTGLVLRMTSEPMSMLLSSGGPGISGLCGQGDWLRVEKVRTEMFIMAIAGMTLIGSGVIALNEWFLALWVGKGYFAGQMTNVLLVLAAIVKVFFRVDTVIVSGLLELRRQALSSLISGLVVVVVGGSLCRFWGMQGMALGSLLGYILQWCYLQSVIYGRMPSSIGRFWRSLFVLAGTMLVVLLLSLSSSLQLQAGGWYTFLLNSGMCAVLVSLILWFIGLRSEQRHMLLAKIHVFRALLQ